MANISGTADSLVKSNVQLQNMKSLANAWTDEDDWTGLADASLRRKRQNRLNQRASRKSPNSPRPHAPKSSEIAGQRKVVKSQVSSFRPSLPPRLPEDWQMRAWEHDQPPSSSVTVAGAVAPRNRPLLPYITPDNPFCLEGPIFFPLTADHLITIVQYNVLRATLTNMTILSLLSLFPPECSNALLVPFDVPRGAVVPPSLEPTALQRSTPHEYWIDMFPSPQFRDNLIRERARFDPDDLCEDVMGGLFEGYSDIELRGVLAWSDPWHPAGWELTEGFCRRWSFLLVGCHDLLRATNAWRARRGEDPLLLDLP